jgi:hypothetical protein
VFFPSVDFDKFGSIGDVFEKELEFKIAKTGARVRIKIIILKEYFIIYSLFLTRCKKNKKVALNNSIFAKQYARKYF